MKILLISPNYPFPPDKGEKIRINSLVEILSAEFEQVDLICLSRDSSVNTSEHKSLSNVNLLGLYKINKLKAIFRMLGAILFRKTLTSAYFKEPSFCKAIRNLDLNIYDHVLVFSSGLSFLLSEISNKNFTLLWDLIDFDSIKWKKLSIKHFFKKYIYLRESRLLAKEEEKIVDFADKVFLISRREIQQRSLSPEQTEKLDVVNLYIQTGSNISTEDKETNRIIFTGQMDYYPNIEAVTFFHDQVLPNLETMIPEVEFIVAGRGAADSLVRHCENAYFTGEVENITSCIISSKLFVVPLLSVFGVPTKIIEAMTLGLPVVLTSEAAATLGLQHEQEVFIADKPEDFANACCRLLEDKELQKKLIDNSNRFLEENHSFEKIKAQIKEIL